MARKLTKTTPVLPVSDIVSFYYMVYKYDSVVQAQHVYNLSSYKSTKKDFITMISVVVCVLLVVNLIQIHHLKQEVTELRAETRNELRAVSNSLILLPRSK